MQCNNSFYGVCFLQHRIRATSNQFAKYSKSKSLSVTESKQSPWYSTSLGDSCYGFSEEQMRADMSPKASVPYNYMICWTFDLLGKNVAFHKSMVGKMTGHRLRTECAKFRRTLSRETLGMSISWVLDFLESHLKTEYLQHCLWWPQLPPKLSLVVHGSSPNE